MVSVRKVLFVANSDRHIKLCHIPYMKMFHDNDYLVHVATDTKDRIIYCDKKINIGLRRNPYHIMNIFALFNLRRLVKIENYDLISCHTPIGAVLGRCCILGLSKKSRPKVIYTAQGFHFYKGAGIINWIIYYPIEKFLSRFTDAIITMNEEDYTIAKKRFHCDVYKINGIGLREERLLLQEKNLRKRLNLKNKFVVTYIAEVSKRKNQLSFLRVLKKYHLNRRIVFLFVGDSNINNINDKLSSYKNVKYVGFHDNIGDYINMSDLIISPSRQEGLPQNILEALYFHKVVIGMNIRGTKDLLGNNRGVLVNDLDEMINKIIDFEKHPYQVDNFNLDEYKIENVSSEVKKIVNNYLEKKIK